MRELVRTLVTAPLAEPIDDLGRFLDHLDGSTRAGAGTIERAAFGGLSADRLGFAFAAGYREALRKLVPGLGHHRAALCVTERGGGHPRAIETTLTPDGDGYLVSGHKRWATMARHVDVLLVVASLGESAAKKILRLVRVDARAPGVTFRAMPPTPFCPEIEHAEVDLERVRVAASDLLPGDGYEAYQKPFRTIEDLHVVAAALGYAARCARRFGVDRVLVDRAAATLVALDAVAALDPLDPAGHLALAGALANAAPIFEATVAALRTAGGDAAGVASLLERDLPLLSIAGNVRAMRTARAAELLAAGGAPRVL
jgi:acyl-CoA dehydrogenase